LSFSNSFTATNFSFGIVSSSKPNPRLQLKRVKTVIPLPCDSACNSISFRGKPSTFPDEKDTIRNTLQQSAITKQLQAIPPCCGGIELFALNRLCNTLK
jgi:hypothetical protein